MAWGSHVPSFLAFWKRRIGTESQSSPRPEMVAYRSRMWPSEWAMAPASLVRRCSVLLRGQLDGVERFSSLRPTERRWCRRACRDIAPRTQALGRRDADEEPGRRDRDRRAGESNPKAFAPASLNLGHAESRATCARMTSALGRELQVRGAKAMISAS